MLRGLSGTQRYALLVAVVVVVVVVYLLVSGGLNELTGSGSDDNQSQQAQSEEVVTPIDTSVALGDSARVGDIVFEVAGISYPDRVRIEGLWREPAQRFAQVLVEARNVGKASAWVPLDALRIVASDGRSFLADGPLSAGAARVAQTTLYAAPLTLQPGLPVTLLLIFELPNNAGGLQLRASGAWVDFALTTSD